MSHAGMNNTSGGPTPPSVPTSFVTDVNSPSVPIANVENVKGGNSSTNNILGIQTDGSSGSNTLTVQLTNRFAGTVTTTNATPTTLTTCPMPLFPAVYLFYCTVNVYNVTDNIGEAETATFAFRTTSASTAVILPSADFGVFSDPGFSALVTINYIGTTTPLTVQVIGIAGKTIHWSCTGTYTVVN